MSTNTSGHLSNNGGIRGHSAGDFYPYRVMAQGTLTSLKYWVINPAGEKVKAFSSSALACTVARGMSYQLRRHNAIAKVFETA